MSENLSESPSALVWVTEARAEAAASICRAAGLRVVTAGSPETGRGTAVAETLDAQAATDARAAIAGAEVDLVLIVDPGGFGEHAEDVEAASAAAQRGATIVSLEPLFGSGASAANAGWLGGSVGGPLDRVFIAPRLRSCKGYVEADELTPELGDPRSAVIVDGGGALDGSAGARLYASVALLHSLIGAPEFVDAAYIPSPDAKRETRRATDISGTVHVLARFGDGRSASVIASDRWASAEQRTDLLYPDARLSVTPSSYALIGADGERRDSFAAEKLASPTDLVGAQIRALLDPASPAPPPLDARAVLATLDAIMLSCRSGQAESTEVTRRALGR